jgi:lactose/L-arabinose transport system substrate-binding protein
LASPPSTTPPRGEITIWNRSGDLYQVFDAVIADFNQKYPRIKVNHLQVDIDAKLPNTLISGADVPDGSFWEDTQVAGHAPHLSDLSELLAPYVDDIAPYKIDINTVDGKIFGVPWDLDPGLLYYRADLLDDAGVDPAGIETYDNLLEAARALRDTNPDARPIHLDQVAFLGQLWLEMLANQQGTSLADADGQLRLDSPEYRTIFEWIQSVVADDLGTHAPYLEAADIETLESGQQALVPWAIWWNFAPQQLLEETKGLWRAMPLPAWTSGGARSGAMGGSSFVIPAKAQNPELAWLFYEFLVFDPNGYRKVYGPNDLYPGGLNTSIPSYQPAWEDNLFEPIEELGGQDLWPVAVEAGQQIPGGAPIPSWWARAADYLGDNLQRLIEQEMTPDDVIAESTRQIQSNLVERD